jgi:hypothetical protein
MNTLSNTSSSPVKPVNVTLWVMPVVALAAPLELLKGVAWFTPAKVATPATIPLDTVPLNETAMFPVFPLGGSTAYQMEEYRLVVDMVCCVIFSLKVSTVPES